MLDFFGVPINVETMTLEELEEARAKILILLKNIALQIQFRKMYKHKHSDNSHSPH